MEYTEKKIELGRGLGVQKNSGIEEKVLKRSEFEKSYMVEPGMVDQVKMWSLICEFNPDVRTKAKGYRI